MPGFGENTQTSVGQQRFRPHFSKDDPSDVSLLMDLIYLQRDRYKPWMHDTVETRKIQLLSEYRRKVVNEQTALTNRPESLLKGYF